MKDEKSSKEERGKNVEWFYSSLILYPSSLPFYPCSAASIARNIALALFTVS